jgi:hypothetical protein
MSSRGKDLIYLLFAPRPRGSYNDLFENQVRESMVCSEKYQIEKKRIF